MWDPSACGLRMTADVGSHVPAFARASYAGFSKQGIVRGLQQAPHPGRGTAFSRGCADAAVSRTIGGVSWDSGRRAACESRRSRRLT
jgi:hypothetical protein